MRKIIILLLFSLLGLFSLGQSFEGVVTYSNSYSSKNPNIKDEQISAMMGTVQKYYISNGNYKIVTNGTFYVWQTYINKDNKLYSKMFNSEIVLWNDCSVNTDSVYSFQLNREVTSILGYKCDELILNCKSGIQKYYFSSVFKIEPSIFINHNYSNWLYVINKSNALPLRTIIQNNQFTMISTATNISRKKIKFSQFELPKNVKLIKNTY